jgi:hypothetical protein
MVKEKSKVVNADARPKAGRQGKPLPLKLTCLAGRGSSTSVSPDLCIPNEKSPGAVAEVHSR